MPVSGKSYDFKDSNIDNSPAKHGVYALFDGEELIYYGRAAGDGVTIRSRLRDHKSGNEGRCTKNATSYMREVTDRPRGRERELLQEYEDANGSLPRCNEVMP